MNQLQNGDAIVVEWPSKEGDDASIASVTVVKSGTATKHKWLPTQVRKKSTGEVFGILQAMAEASLKFPFDFAQGLRLFEVIPGDSLAKYCDTSFDDVLSQAHPI